MDVGIECSLCGMKMMQSQADGAVICLRDGCPLPEPAKRGAAYKAASDKDKKETRGIVICRQT